MKLTDVVLDKVSEAGVLPITAGNVVSAQVRDGLRAILKQYDEEGYALYRATKYPTGEGSDTPETRLAATRFLFDRTRDLLTTHYLSSKEG
jgi:hypothetical protein